MYFYNTGGSMPQWLAERRFSAAGNEDKLSQYGYGPMRRMQTAGSYMGQMGLMTNPFVGRPQEMDFDDPYMYQQAMDQWMASLSNSQVSQPAMPSSTTMIPPSGTSSVAPSMSGFPQSWLKSVPLGDPRLTQAGPTAEGTAFASPLTPMAQPVMGPIGAAQVAAPTTAAALAPYEGSSIYDFMLAQQKAPDLVSRKQLAKMVGIPNYTGTATQNMQMMEKIKQNPTILSSYAPVASSRKSQLPVSEKAKQVVDIFKEDDTPLAATPKQIQQVADTLGLPVTAVQTVIDTLKASGSLAVDSSGIPIIDSATAAALDSAIADTTGLNLGSLDLPSAGTTQRPDSLSIIKKLADIKSKEQSKGVNPFAAAGFAGLLGMLAYKLYKEGKGGTDLFGKLPSGLEKIDLLNKSKWSPELLSKLDDAERMLSAKAAEKGIEWTDYVANLWKQAIKTDDVKLLKDLAKEAGVEWTSLLSDDEIKSILNDQELKVALKADNDVKKALSLVADEGTDKQIAKEASEYRKAQKATQVKPVTKAKPLSSITESMSPALKAKLTRAMGRLRGSALRQSANLAEESVRWYTELSPLERQLLNDLNEQQIADEVVASKSGKAFGSTLKSAATSMRDFGRGVSQAVRTAAPKFGQVTSRIGSELGSAGRTGLEAAMETPWIRRGTELLGRGRKFLRFQDAGIVPGTFGLYDPLSGVTERLSPEQYKQAYNQGQVGWWQRWNPQTKQYERAPRGEGEFVSSTKELDPVVVSYIDPDAASKMLQEDRYLRSRRPDSYTENFVEWIDPTGATSWDDIGDTFRNPNSSAWDKGLAVFSAVPMLGKFGKAAKGAKATTKLGKVWQGTQKGLDWVGGMAPQRYIDAANPLIRFTQGASGNLLSNLPRGFQVGARVAGDINQAERFWKGLGTLTDAAGMNVIPSMSDKNYAINVRRPDGTVMLSSTLSEQYREALEKGWIDQNTYDPNTNTINMKYADGGDSGTYSAGVYYKNGGMYAYQDGGDFVNQDDKFGGTYMSSPMAGSMLPNYGYGGMGKMKKGGSRTPKLGAEMDLSEAEIKRLQSLGYKIEYV